MMATPDLTPQQVKAALMALKAEMGPHSDIFAQVWTSAGADTLYASVYPQGISRGEHALGVFAETWSDLVTKLRDGWAAISAEHRTKQIRKMALAIIRITAEFGECSEAALRAEFSPGELASLGAEACADADVIASNGPFAIQPSAKANAA